MDCNSRNGTFKAPVPLRVLLIGREPIIRIYTDEVLKSAGFIVHAVTPWEARSIIRDGVSAYSLVIFCNTLSPEDVTEIGSQLRRTSPELKRLLILGPATGRPGVYLFDASIEGLEGPAALVRQVRKMTQSSPSAEPVDGQLRKIDPRGSNLNLLQFAAKR